MLRDWNAEFESRVAFVKEVLAKAGAKGVVFGNSGGKDSALVGIIARAATENTVGVIMPCVSSRNFGIDREHALLVAKKYDIKTMEIDLSQIKREFVKVLEGFDVPDIALANINPRLRMTALYALAQSLGYLVAGTSNRSELTMGYFTKWGDGASDFNPISDLTATEVFEFLEYLGAPREIIEKAPSAGLWEGQTDEQEMGITYKAIDDYLLYGKGNDEDIAKIRRAYEKSRHKRAPALSYAPFIDLPPINQ